MSHVCPRVPFLPGSKMTLFTFYNYFDHPLKPLASLLNVLLQILMCILKFVFLPESKMAHFTKKLTYILQLLFSFYNYFDLPLKQVQVDLPLKLLRRIDCGCT